MSRSLLAAESGAALQARDQQSTEMAWSGPCRKPKVAQSKDGRKGGGQGQRGGRQDFRVCMCTREECGEWGCMFLLVAVVSMLGRAWSWESGCRGLWGGQGTSDLGRRGHKERGGSTQDSACTDPLWEMT